jgi:alpha 1,2-mannosyltransferase
MAAGTTRLVRYIVVAIFVGAGSRRPSSDQLLIVRSQIVLILFFVSRTPKEYLPSTSQIDWNKVPSWGTSKSEGGASSGKSSGEMDDTYESPASGDVKIPPPQPVPVAKPTSKSSYDSSPASGDVDMPKSRPGSSNLDGLRKDAAGAKASQNGDDYPLTLTSANPGFDDLVGIDSGPRMNATFVTLARNGDVWEIARSIRQVEDRFNRRFNYDWVFLNDKPFDATFKRITTSLVSGTTHYAEIPKEHWSFPPHIDQEKAKKVREDMAQRKIIYGDSIPYRHMCRFESGFFFQQEIMKKYEYYWRVEPSVELFCDIHYDPFRYMHENGKKYSFVLSLYEYVETIPTLWDSVKKFMKNHPEHIEKDNMMAFLSDDGGDSYNHCHFVRSLITASLSQRY